MRKVEKIASLERCRMNTFMTCCLLILSAPTAFSQRRESDLATIIRTVDETRRTCKNLPLYARVRLEFEGKSRKDGRWIGGPESDKQIFSDQDSIWVSKGARYYCRVGTTSGVSDGKSASLRTRSIGNDLKPYYRVSVNNLWPRDVLSVYNPVQNGFCFDLNLGDGDSSMLWLSDILRKVPPAEERHLGTLVQLTWRKSRGHYLNEMMVTIDMARGCLITQLISANTYLPKHHKSSSVLYQLLSSKKVKGVNLPTQYLAVVWAPNVTPERGRGRITLLDLEARESPLLSKRLEQPGDLVYQGERRYQVQANSSLEPLTSPQEQMIVDENIAATKTTRQYELLVASFLTPFGFLAWFISRAREAKKVRRSQRDEDN